MIAPPCEIVRISQRGRDQLIKIKRQTGIENWNVISRWALCASLAESTEPLDFPDIRGDGVEMTWKVFSGDASDVLAAAVMIRHREYVQSGGGDSIIEYLRKHIHRGLGYLSSGQPIKSVSEFLLRHR